MGPCFVLLNFVTNRKLRPEGYIEGQPVKMCRTYILGLRGFGDLIRPMGCNVNRHPYLDKSFKILR